MNSNERKESQSHESEAGIGRPDEATLQQRAEELARIEGRQEPNARDFASAREDLVTIGSMPAAPEAAGVEGLTSWDTPLEASGSAAPTNEFDDEANIAVQLVEEGIEEADHDRRVAASEVQNSEDS